MISKMDEVCRHIGHMTMYDFHDLSTDLEVDGNGLSYIPMEGPLDRTEDRGVGVGGNIGTSRGTGTGSGSGMVAGLGSSPGSRMGTGSAGYGTGSGDIEIEAIIRSMRMVVNDRTRVRRLCRHQQLSILALRLLLKSKNDEIFS